MPVANRSASRHSAAPARDAASPGAAVHGAGGPVRGASLCSVLARTAGALSVVLLAAISPAMAQDDAGAYLAARHASAQADYRNAAQYYTEAMISDPKNVVLLENALLSFLAAGDMDRAVPVARRMFGLKDTGEIASMVLLADAAGKGDWDQAMADLDGGASVGKLVDGLARAWIMLGQGRMSEANAAFDAVAATEGLNAFGLYHKALALASAGDFEGADAIFSSKDGGPLGATRRGLTAHAQVLSQLERSDEAIALIDAATGGTDVDPALTALRARLAGGEVLPFTAVTSARDGLAEVFFSVATALNGDVEDTITLLYARIAQNLRPDDVDTILLSAGLLEQQGQYDMATGTYNLVPGDNPVFYVAELGRANALVKAGRDDAAIEVLQQLAKTNADVVAVQVTLGDQLRRAERFEDATQAYDRAIALFDTVDPAHWMVYYARGITQERSGRWTEAEADFRKALDLNPDQPQVLNYLGYSFVEMNRNLDEALGMIERAVKGKPNDGYITDSLGWAYYRLGRFQEAAVQMERAAELEPTDPVVNDHLGDALWAVGRKLEAKFEWRRALSFEPAEADAARIRRKLDIGLDAVLSAEGAKPLAVTKNDN